MPRFARLFQNPDDVVDAWRETLRQADVEGALALWLDDDSITCVLPEGNRLSGHAEIRSGIERMLNKPLYLEPIACIEHITMGANVRGQEGNEKFASLPGSIWQCQFRRLVLRSKRTSRTICPVAIRRSLYGPLR